MTDENSRNLAENDLAENERRAQTNITWKPGRQRIFQAALEAWTQTAAKGAGAGDFIIDLIQNRNRNETEDTFHARLSSLGIMELVEIHRRRMEADARMLEQIADVVDDARAKAREEVYAEIAGLQAEIAALKKTAAVAGQTAENEAARCAQLEASVHELSGSLEAEWENAARTGGELETARDELREARINLDEAKKRASALETELTQSRDELHAARNEAISARNERDKAILERDRLALEFEAARAGLDEAQTNADRFEAAQMRLDETSSMLADARFAMSALEAKAQAQSETIKALREAIASFGRPAIIEPEKNRKPEDQAEEIDDDDNPF